MNYWLMKTEPSEFSWLDLWNAPERTARWDGVRNYQARGNLRRMRVGDHAFIYHSGEKPLAIVGIAEIVREAYADPTQFDATSAYFDAKSKPEEPRWSSVDVRALKGFKAPLLMESLRREAALNAMVLLNNTRLSVQPVTREEWAHICQMAGISV